MANAAVALGRVERQLNNVPAALAHYAEAAALYRSLGDSLKLAHTIRHLGDIHRGAGQAEQARQCYDEALTIYRGPTQPQPLDLANAIRGLALLEGDCGELERAKALWAEAKELYAEAGVKEGAAECIDQLAALATQDGRSQ